MYKVTYKTIDTKTYKSIQSLVDDICNDISLANILARKGACTGCPLYDRELFRCNRSQYTNEYLLKIIKEYYKSITDDHNEYILEEVT